MYKDITSHSQGDSERKPRVLANVSNGVEFIVHKHIYYCEEWLLTCRELGVKEMALHTEDMEDAKEKAIVEMIKLFGNAICKYQKAITELEN
ncbi:hypothetical protein OBO34_19465 [Clostridiales Family XIII bacterium ASD5510]|uniref:Uncharacterized protein n=1 Tax=Hominibacterium faecale TaxID=2839743 RepID=A0A9J6QYB0_9FIRM|nr:hypothetical protein [Hominibacterium faecale]MCU7380494.1 hypothetical protein [Hominibacterium faecale]